MIDEIQASPKPIILFIDEAHTLIGAGGAAGTGDAANLLKPALARGTLRTIAATTWAEYKKFIEPDAALTRRFQTGQGRGARASRWRVRDDARRRRDAGEAPQRADARRGGCRPRSGCRSATFRRGSCPTSRSACSTPPARASPSSQAAVPAELEDCRRRIEALEAELAMLERERDLGWR